MEDIPAIINYKGERRKSFHIDWSLNISTIITLLVLLYSMVKYGSESINILNDIRIKTNIMWNHFDKSQINKTDLDSVQKLQ